MNNLYNINLKYTIGYFTLSNVTLSITHHSYYENKFKSIEPRTNKIYTNVWRTKPRVVGQP